MTDTYFLLGNLITFRARNSVTGALTLVEARTAPGAGAPANRHPGDDEIFYVLDGRYEFALNGKSRTCGPGDCIEIPNGAVHSFKNVGDGIGRMVIVNWPGKQHEQFFTTVGEALAAGTTDLPESPAPVDIPHVIQIGKRCGIEFL